jgi:hypothetical protein
MRSHLACVGVACLLHPNASGAMKVAAKWFAALTPLFQ